MKGGGPLDREHRVRSTCDTFKPTRGDITNHDGKINHLATAEDGGYTKQHRPPTPSDPTYSGDQTLPQSCQYVDNCPGVRIIETPSGSELSAKHRYLIPARTNKKAHLQIYLFPRVQDEIHKVALSYA